jgi:hypothetical protein
MVTIIKSSLDLIKERSLETKQIGFLLLGIFNFISSILILFLKIGSQEEEQEEDGEEYGD